MCREPGRPSTLDKGHEEGGSAYANAGSSFRSPPGYSRASPAQKNQSLLLYCFVLSPLISLEHPDRAELERRIQGRLPAGWQTRVPVFTKENGNVASRAASQAVLNALAPVLPE